MDMIKSTQNSEHFTWGNNCDGWHLLKTESLSVIQERMPPGTSERLHFHSRCQQLFFILSGVATFEIEGHIYIVNAKETIHIPIGAKHSVVNKSEKDLEFLVISEPKSHGDRKEV